MLATATAVLGLLNPEDIIRNGGLLVLCAIIFAESGLFFGFFLPGDSLLFIAGFLSGDVLPALPIVIVAVFAAAVLGDQVGYWFGRKVGPALFSRPDSKLFKQEHVERSKLFFEKHGSKTIVLARFVPVVRTFAPIVAGVSEMPYGTFVTYNVIGAALWAGGLTTAGYFLGQIDVVKNNIELAVLAVVALSLIPVVVEVVKHRRAAKAEAASGSSTPSR